jgi:Ser/Thr protein kinase RdoA (MazF antagonist)
VVRALRKGVIFVAERDFSILEQYDCKLYSTSRGRGAFICETSRGRVLLREHNGNPGRIRIRAQLLEYLSANGINVDYYLKNVEGQYISSDSSGTQYTLTTWFDAQECDVKNFQDVCTAVGALAALHNVLEGYDVEKDIKEAADLCEDMDSQDGGTGGGETATDSGIAAEQGERGVQEFQIARNLEEVYDKHNRELKMIGNYLKGKHKKNDFELLAASMCQPFLDEGLRAVETIKHSGYDAEYAAAIERSSLCHGDYSYHNVFIKKQKGYICGFEQSCVDIRLVDLYGFMRKLMEKYDWDIKLGYLMLREYDRVNTLSSQDIKILGAMFAYPEKFWKILNYYFNNNKAWIPGRSMEKLRTVVNQNRMRREFVRTLYGSR